MTSWLRDKFSRQSFTRAPGITAPVRSTTVPLMVPVDGCSGPCSFAVALEAAEGCGDCASPGKEQSRSTPSKRKRGPRQGRLPLLETNRQRVRPKDFSQEPFLAKFTVEPFFTLCLYACSRQGFDGPGVSKVSTRLLLDEGSEFQVG